MDIARYVSYSAVEHYINEKYFVKNYVENRNKLNFFLKYIISSKISYFRNIKLIIWHVSGKKNGGIEPGF